jgi:hypothetical protein
MDSTLPKTPKTARGRSIISFKQCRWNCRCGRDPAGGPYFLKTWREAGSRGRACVSWREVAAFLHGPPQQVPQKPKIDETLPKIAIGSLHLEFKRCGRPNCRCGRGLVHGPYAYKHWRENGRQKKEYVPMKQLGEITLELERQRAEAARPAEVRRVLKELRHV